MTPIFIYESGICPWEESKPPLCAPFATVSVVVASHVELMSILNGLLPAMGGAFTSWFRWHTQLLEFEGNAMQRKRLLASLSANVGRFGNPVVRSNEDVLYSVANMLLPITAYELETLSDYQRECLIGSKDQYLTTETLSTLLTPYVSGADPTNLAALLTSKNYLAFGRLFHDPDTHYAFQWFGCETDLRLLSQALEGLNIRLLASRNDVSELLRQ